MLLPTLACLVIPSVQGPEPALPIQWVGLTPRRVSSSAGIKIGISKTRVITGKAKAEAKDKGKRKGKRKGKGKGSDIHVVEFHTTLAEITGLRIEVHGAGRGREGQYEISEVSVSSAPLNKPKRFRQEMLIHAVTKDEQPKQRACNLIDNNTGSTWGGTKGGRNVVLELATPISNKKGSKIVLNIEYHGHGASTLGEFGVSATSDTAPLREVGNPFSEGWPAIQAKIDKAIDRGCARLIAQQERDGSWRQHQPNYRSGQTTLCLYALVKSGVPRTHVSVRRAVEYLRSNQPQKTYSLALLILGLCSIDADLHRKWIAKSIKEMISWQRRGFAYPNGNVDLSNTQYAAIALRTAANKGFKIPPSVWLGLKEYAQRCQERRASKNSPTSIIGSEPLGFSYRQGGKATGSMTTAGLAVMAICREQMRKQKSITQSIESGLSWMVANFSQTCNPSSHKKFAPHSSGNHLHYFLYGVERVGGLLDLNLLGPYDWYRKGAIFLVDTQTPEGQWGNPDQTCFALLFLSRATRKSAGGPTTGSTGVIARKTIGVDDPDAPVSIRAAGNRPLTFWISSYGTATLKDYEWPREEGRGPRVVRVEYYAHPKGNPKARHQVAIAEGDPKSPAGKLSFSAQHQFRERGHYMISAEVTVVTPVIGGYAEAANATLRGDEDRTKTLKSPPIEVLIRAAKEIMTTEELFRYAKDPILNLLADRTVTVTASSERGNGWAAKLVSDNLQSRAWNCKRDDKWPWVNLSLSKKARANVVLLSPALDFAKAGGQAQRNFSKIRIRLNSGRGGAYEVEMTQDPRRKTVLELPKAVLIKSLRVEILEKGQAEVGFAEIELQLQKD